MTRVSGFYTGAIMHRRVRQSTHAFRYRVFMTLFDLDEVARGDFGTRFLSRNRTNVLSFWDRDHLECSDRPLRAQVEDLLAEAGIAAKGGAITLLCMPRLFGYVFNPISVFFCHRADGTLAAILYAVRNTFGQRHAYLIPVAPDQRDHVKQSCAKCFYVSPFMDMGLTYDFDIEVPAAKVVLRIDARDAGGLVIATGFSGQRVELSDGAVLRAVLAHPLMTLKVIAGIHWEALWIFVKGIKLRPRPPAPATAVTIVSLDEHEVRQRV